MDPDDELHIWMDPEVLKATIMDMKCRDFIKSRIQMIFGWDDRKFHNFL